MAVAPSNSDFLVRYPEFAGAPSALVTARLAEAARSTNSTVFQSAELCTDAVMLLGAILLLRSPAGRKMRTESPEQYLTWEYELRKLQRSATIGLRVW